MLQYAANSNQSNNFNSRKSRLKASGGSLQSNLNHRVCQSQDKLTVNRKKSQ